MNEITQDHKDHIEQINRDFTTAMSSKYVMGVKEHGGHLKDMTAVELLDNALDEAIDQVVYIMTLKDKLRDIEEKAWKYDELH